MADKDDKKKGEEKPDEAPDTDKDNEKVIKPDFDKVLRKLTDEVESLKSEKEEWNKKGLGLQKQLDDLKKNAPKEIVEAAKAIFAPWDLFFGE